VFASTPVFDYELLTEAYPSIFTTYNSQFMAVNPLSHIGYVYATDPDPGLVEFDLDTMTVIRESLFTTIMAPLGLSDTGDIKAFSNVAVGWDGAFYFITGDNVNGPNIVRVDPNTLLATAYFDAPNSAAWNGTAFGFANRICFITILDPTEGLVSQLLVGSVDNDIGSLSIPDLGYVWGDGVDPIGVSCTALVQGKIALGRGEAWQFVINSTTELFINKIAIDGGLVPSLAAEASFAPSDFDVAATTFASATNQGPVIYDEGDDGLLFQVYLMAGSSPFTKLVKWSQTSGIIFSVTPPTGFVGSSANVSFGSRISSGTYAILDTNGVVWYLNSATGVEISSETWPGLTAGANSNQAYDSGRQIILAYILLSGGGGGWAKLRIGRISSAGTTLGDIVLDQCLRAGFVEADVDVSTLTDVVEGFVISQRSLVIDVLKPLMQIYLVDAVESDYVLKFTHRGGTVAANLTEADLVRTGEETEPFVETRQQEIELPMRVTFTYIDSDKDFQQNTQIAKRSRHPNPTVFTDNQTDLQVAVVSTATPAKQMAERIMYSVWNERKSYAARLPPKYGYLDAADPITLTLNDGYQVRGRLGKADIGVDHSLDTTIIVETTQQTISIATADDGVPWSGSNAISDPSPSKLILLDTPLLRDGDDLGGTAMRGYWAAGSYRTTGGWPGAALQASHDGATWGDIDVTANEMTWGAIETPPPDPASFWRTQFDGTMTVRVTGGTYVPTTTNDLGLANLENPMAVIKANGEVEIVQYRDVTALGSGRYTLSVLYRGVRGTDAMGGGLRSGDIFVFLSTTGVSEASVPLAEHNVLDFYRAVTAGSLSATSLVMGFTYHGRDLMPYAPDNAVATLSGSDVVLTWVRRTRFAGEMRDGIDTVPLNEATEAYEIDILSGPGGSVLRTLNSVTSTVTYSAGQIATDFGTRPASLSVDIYQMSAVVGRGFATEELLEIA
jgi:hypothetical protein